MNTIPKPSKTRESMTQVSFAAQPKLRRVLGRGLLVGLVATVMIALTAKIESLSYQNYLRDLKLDATVNMIDVRERIEKGLFDYTVAMNRLTVALGQTPDMSREAFEQLAGDLIANLPEARAVSAAPGFVVDQVYPAQANASMIGTVVAHRGEHYLQVAEALRAAEGLIVGPTELPDGTQVLILKKPVFNAQDADSLNLWGIALIALDYQAAIERLGISEFEERFDLLISETSALSARDHPAIFGDPDLKLRQPIELALNFAFGHLQLSATPAGGWPTTRPGSFNSWVERGMLIAICLITLWYVISLLDRRRLAEKLLSTGIEALDHGFVMFDSNRRLVAFNNKYKQLAGGSGMVRIGARYEDIVKANLAAGLIPDAVGREDDWYEEWSERFKEKAADKEQVLADGRLIRAYDRPMEDGSVVGLRIDITDLKKAQIAAEAANKAKTDFMGVLSHELRTPLTVILGHAQLARNLRNMPVYKKLKAEIDAHPEAAADIQPKLDAVEAQVVKMMTALERSGNHLFTLISEILDFAKIDSGTLSMDIEDVTSAAITDPIAEQMRPMVEEKGLTLDVDRVDCPMSVDPKRIQQVLINLIGNATKFTDTGGIQLKVTEDADDMVFSVTDTGMGIPEEHLGKVFDAFHQVDSTSGRKFGGTGLGLAISRDIARAHGGDLTATSVVGKGSTFTLRLPRGQAVSLAPDTPEAKAA